uniref:Uncharacterized protein n=1 Tax=Triticum urartu TaxID=4572 RepID=A0A8R7QQM0_TRIUA
MLRVVKVHAEQAHALLGCRRRAFDYRHRVEHHWGPCGYTYAGAAALLLHCEVQRRRRARHEEWCWCVRRHPGGRAEEDDLPPHCGVTGVHAAEVEALTETVLVERGWRRGRHEEPSAAGAEAPRAVVRR